MVVSTPAATPATSNNHHHHVTDEDDDDELTPPLFDHEVRDNEENDGDNMCHPQLPLSGSVSEPTEVDVDNSMSSSEASVVAVR